jgi:signal transduction histidine kinase
MKRGWQLSFSWRGLTPQLFALVVLPLSGLLLIVAFGGLSLHRQEMRMMVGERDERAVRAAASAISEQLSHREKAVRNLALLAGESESSADLEAALIASDYLLVDFDFGLAFYARGGGLLASTGDTNFWTGLDATTSPLKEALARDVPPIFLLLPHPQTGEPIILSLAVSQKGGPVAMGAFDPASLAQRALVGGFTSDGGSVVYLADATGSLLYQAGTPLAAETPETHPGIQEALAGVSGTSYIPAQGGEHVVSYSPISLTGWALVIEEPWEAVITPLLRTTEYAPFVLIPAFILALVALWFGVRQIVQPLQALEREAAALGWGNYEAIEESVGGIEEIQHLQNELIHLAHKVKAAQAGLRGYIGAITTGQEEERRRLARELHDDTLQALIALNQRIQLTRLSLQDPVSVASLVEIQDLTTNTMENLRRITRALRPIYLEDLGLVAALEVLTREIEQTGGFPVLFLRKGEPRRLAPQVELALYRMAQEALSNAVRHAGASQCSLEITFVPEGVKLVVQDNGRGFIPPESLAELAPQGHFGLLGLHERAELIGAKLEIQTALGSGTTIQIRLNAVTASH